MKPRWHSQGLVVKVCVPNCDIGFFNRKDFQHGGGFLKLDTRKSSDSKSFRSNKQTFLGGFPAWCAWKLVPTQCIKCHLSQSFPLAPGSWFTELWFTGRGPCNSFHGMPPWPMAHHPTPRPSRSALGWNQRRKLRIAGLKVVFLVILFQNWFHYQKHGRLNVAFRHFGKKEVEKTHS